MFTRLRWAGLLVLAAVSFTPAQDGKYSVKVAKNEVPKEVDESIRKLMGSESITFLESGKPIAEFWLRSEIPVDATPAQLKNGVTYREIKQTELVGVIKFHQKYYDYRKQNVKPGVYTLRNILQPQDGDHAGKSPFLEFFVASSAAADKKADTIGDIKSLMEMSQKSIDTGHPAVFMLFPAKPGTAAKVDSKPNMHWVVTTQREVTVKGQKTGSFLGISLTLVGHADE
jgi:hypothetical protein